MAIARDADDREQRYRHRGRTTIELSESDAGRWRATQHGVEVCGYGDSAAAAAAAFCRRVDALEE